MQARSSEMTGCALCLRYPHRTPSPSSSHPEDAPPGCHPDNRIFQEYEYHNDFQTLGVQNTGISNEFGYLYETAKKPRGK